MCKKRIRILSYDILLSLVDESWWNMAKGADLKNENRIKVKKCFYDGEILNKYMIIKMTGLSNGAVTNILAKMLESGEIMALGDAESTGGRKKKQYALNRDHVHVLNVIVKKKATTNEIAASFIDPKGHAVSSSTCFEADCLRERIMAIIGGAIIADPLIKVIAISIPGVVHDGLITICDCEQLVGWPIVADIFDRFGLEATIENDVNAACLGFYQLHQDSSAVAFLYQPRVKYVGCGMVLNHQLFKGANSFAGELSYLPFADFSKQEILLKTDPQGLLKTQLISLCCVVNPDVIGICSDNFAGLPDWDFSRDLPDTHVPRLEAVDDFYDLVKLGLFASARDYLISNEI